MPVIKYSEYESTTQSVFMRLKGGENRVRIVSKPHSFTKTFREEEGPKPRYGWVVIDREDDEAKLLEVGPQVFGQVVALANDDDYGNPKGYDIKIMKTGEGLDTEYKVVPSPDKSKLTSTEKKKVKELPLDPATVFVGEEELEGVNPKDVPVG